MFELFQTTRFDFMGRRSVGFVVSGALLLASLGCMVWRSTRTGDAFNYGIDFRGGSLFQIRLADPPPTDEIRHALSKAGFGDAVLQRFAPPEDDTVLIRVRENLEDSPDLVSRILTGLQTESRSDNRADLNTMGDADLAALLEREITGEEAKSRAPEFVAAAKAIIAVRNAQDRGLLVGLSALDGAPGVDASIRAVLERATYTGGIVLQRSESVGPAVGKDLRKKALFASLVANGLILLYLSMRFEFRYGVAAVITLVHDLTVLLGVLSLTGREFDLPVLAALLTVIGYSVNDTIVVFDRIRLSLRTMRRESLLEVINFSINQTLSRTILTSGSTLLVVVPLFLFGGVVLNNFAFALLVGIVVGTYSTVFVASPVLLLWQKYLIRS